MNLNLITIVSEMLKNGKKASPKAIPESKAKKTPMTKAEFERLGTGRVEYLFRDSAWVHLVSMATGIIPQDMEPVYGRQDFAYRGEYLVKVWAFKDGEDHHFICTAPNRGATIESTSKDRSKLEQFLTTILKNTEQ